MPRLRSPCGAGKEAEPPVGRLLPAVAAGWRIVSTARLICRPELQGRRGDYFTVETEITAKQTCDRGWQQRQELIIAPVSASPKGVFSQSGESHAKPIRISVAAVREPTGAALR